MTSPLKINLIEKYDARKGGRYFEAETVVAGVYFCKEALSRTKAIRELKKLVYSDPRNIRALLDEIKNS